jgi:hypothetical protein
LQFASGLFAHAQARDFGPPGTHDLLSHSEWPLRIISEAKHSAIKATAAADQARVKFETKLRRLSKAIEELHTGAVA